MAEIIEPIKENVESNIRALSRMLDIRPNDNGKANNFDAVIVEASLTSSNPYNIVHSLERVPVGIIPLSQDAFGSIIIVSSDDTTITVRSDVNMNVKLWIL